MDQTPERAMDRRAFLQRVSAAAAASALAPAAALAQSSATPVAPATPPPPAAAAPAAPSEDARALTAILQRRFEGRLDAEQWESVARDFEADLATGRRLRALPLRNADEPDSTFRA